MQDPDDDALQGRYDMQDAHHAGIGCITLLLVVAFAFGLLWVIFEGFTRLL